MPHMPLAVVHYCSKTVPLVVHFVSLFISPAFVFSTLPFLFTRGAQQH